MTSLHSLSIKKLVEKVFNAGFSYLNGSYANAYTQIAICDSVLRELQRRIREAKKK